MLLVLFQCTIINFAKVSIEEHSPSADNIHAFLHYSDRTFWYKLWSLEPTFHCLSNDCRLLIKKSLLPEEVQCFRIAKGYSTRLINLELKLKVTVMTTCKLHVCLTLVRKTKFLHRMYYWTYGIRDYNHLGQHRPMLPFSKSMDTMYLCGLCIAFHFNGPAGFVDLLLKKNYVVVHYIINCRHTNVTYRSKWDCSMKCQREKKEQREETPYNLRLLSGELLDKKAWCHVNVAVVAYHFFTPGSRSIM